MSRQQSATLARTPKPERPLFIPLKSEYFEAFRAGHKRVEYRVHGARWNARVCRVGRAVTLSRGYSGRVVLRGVITGFVVAKWPNRHPDFIACYGDHPEIDVAVITIGII